MSYLRRLAPSHRFPVLGSAGPLILAAALAACGGNDAWTDPVTGGDGATDGVADARIDAPADAPHDAGNDADARDLDARDPDARDAGDATVQDASDADAATAVDAAADGARGDVDASDAGDASAVDASDASDAGPSVLDASADAADATVPPADAGPVLSGACTDGEWRALKTPLAVGGLTAAGTMHEMLLVTDIEGKCRRVLDGSGYSVFVSPDGRAFAWTSIDGWRAGGKLATVGDLSTPTALPAGGINFMSWSPDSQWLAFEVDLDTDASRKSALYVIRANGQSLRKITEDVGMNEGIAWAPDSSRFSYVPGIDSDWQNLHIDCPDKDCLRIAEATPNTPFNATWSPDGSRIAVESYGLRPSLIGVAVVDAATGKTKQVSTGTNSNEEFSSLAWSKAGNRLLYTTIDRTTTSSSWDVGVLCADGSCRTSFRPLVAGGIEQMWGDQKWARDDSRIAFTAVVGANREPHLYTVCPDASCAKDLGFNTDWAWSKDSDLFRAAGEANADAGLGEVAILASCKDGSCEQQLGHGYGVTRSDVSQVSHDASAVAFASSDGIYVAAGMTMGRRISAPGPTGSWGVRWSFDDRYIVYGVGSGTTVESIQAACADGSCRSTALPALPAGIANVSLVGVLAAPSP